MSNKKKSDLDTSKEIVNDNRVINIVQRDDKAQRNKNIIIVVVTLVGLSLVWGIFSSIALRSGNDSIVQSITKVDRSVSGKDPVEDKKDALAAATKMLKDFDYSPTGVDRDARLTALESGDNSVITQDAANNVYFSADADATTKKASYQTLITISSLIKSQSSDDKTIMPLDENMWSFCYADSLHGIVYIPLNVFNKNSGSGMSLEMIYVDGQWKLSPYSLIDSIKLLSGTNNSSSNYNSTTPQASPTK